MIAQLASVVRFELRYHLRRISTWVYFLLLFALGFVILCASAGAWESFDMGGGGRLATSATEISGNLMGLLLMTLPITAALFGHAVHRDFQTRIHPLFFTSPVSKGAYLGGRYLGALLVNLLIFSGAGLGQMVGSWMPFLMEERVGPFALDAYLQTYGFLALPTLAFTGAIFLALAALTRQMLPNYIGGVALLIGYTIAMDQLGDLDDRRVAALLDPFGQAPLALTRRYWTVSEVNTRSLVLDQTFWTNRLLWLGVALVVLGVLYWRFRFSHVVAERSRRRSRRAAAAEAGVERSPGPLVVPVGRRSFAGRAQLLQFLTTARREFWSTVHSVYFAALVGVGLIFTIFMLTQMGEIMETTTYPVTYSVLEAVTGGFALFMIIIITFYAGELVWKERELNASQLHDATPVANWVPFAAKLVSLFGVVLVLQAILGLVGVCAQLAQGYFDIQPGLYLQELFVRQGVMYLLFCVLAMTVHVIVNHKYAGHFVLIAYYIAVPILYHYLGLDHNLASFGSGGETQYSDMNGYGDSWRAWGWFNLYWAGLALLLAVGSNLLWVRGEEAGSAWRLRLARQRMTTPVRVLATVGCLLFLLTGGFVFYNTSVVNEYVSSKRADRDAAEYEKRYGRFHGIPQPRVTSADLDVDIYPEERDLRAKGRFQLVNKHPAPIDSIHVNFPADVTRRVFRFGRPGTAVVEDDEYGYHIYQLATPLAPGDSVTLEWEMDYLKEGFGNTVSNDGAIHNGTFVNNHYFPTIGYSVTSELSDDDKRRKHGLEPKELEPPPDDPSGRRNPDIAHDADWIRFAATVSTSPDQIALAPGYLTREWTEDGRRHFRYEMDAPILNFYSIQSARYAVKKDRWRDVALEIYYHPGHDYNLQRMLDATKKSLEYYTANFGPYPHRQMRIVEFPRYQVFAQSFPNTIPYSEGFGFIAKVEEPDNDYLFRTTAHEVAHQWWGHQVVGGAVQGSTLMSEAMSQYAALMVTEKEFGREGVREFLKFELERYLTGRATERKTEMPLVRMRAPQWYVRYGKGALAMYALRDYLGEDRLNAALRGYLEQVKYQEAPYTNSYEFVEHLRAATPDSLQYVIADLFEHITLYENRATAATATRTGEGSYAVEIVVEGKKVRADSLGSQTDVPMNDWVYIGVFAEATEKDEKLGAPLYLRKHKIPSGRRTIRVEVRGEPARAGIDPLHRLIDRRMDDNTVPVRMPAR